MNERRIKNRMTIHEAALAGKLTDFPEELITAASLLTRDNTGLSAVQLAAGQGQIMQIPLQIRQELIADPEVQRDEVLHAALRMSLRIKIPALLVEPAPTLRKD